VRPHFLEAAANKECPLEEIFEIIVNFLGYLFYGTDRKPRHPFWRNSVRVLGFGGAWISIMSLTGIFPGFLLPLPIMVVCTICGLIVLVTEHEFGATKIAYAAIATMIILVLTAFAVGA
jgi:hypothetical protein